MGFGSCRVFEDKKRVVSPRTVYCGKQQSVRVWGATEQKSVVADGVSDVLERGVFDGSCRLLSLGGADGSCWCRFVSATVMVSVGVVDGLLMVSVGVVDGVGSCQRRWACQEARCLSC